MKFSNDEFQIQFSQLKSSSCQSFCLRESKLLKRKGFSETGLIMSLTYFARA